MIPDSYLVTLGILILALITVESGGLFLKKIVTGKAPANHLQMSFFRAGHAHAAVLLVLSIALLVPLSQVDPQGWLRVLAVSFVPAAAIFMPAGFFLSVIGKNPRKPNRFIILLWIGVGLLTIGLLAAGLSILFAGLGI